MASEIAKAIINETGINEIATKVSSVAYAQSQNKSALDEVSRNMVEMREEIEALKKAPRDSGEGSGKWAPPPGYVLAKNWRDVTAMSKLDKGIIIDREISVDSSRAVIPGNKPLRFEMGGRLNLLRTSRVEIHRPIINESNQQIFVNYQVPRSYPGRWNGDAPVRGYFGWNLERDARWWGLTSEPNAQYVSLEDAEANVTAAEAAAMSVSGYQLPVTVRLPGGRIAWNRPGRLDGLRCTLVGMGRSISGTHLWCDNSRWSFDTSHKIQTEDYPDGTAPVLEIGYQRQPNGPNPDEGFQSGVQHLSICCPLNPSSRVSGVMWSGCGLQEGSGLLDVGVTNYSGYGIGGPHFQRLEFNGQVQRYYSQLNTVGFDKLWIMSPNERYPDAMAAAIFGLNWELRNSTLSHQSRKDHFGGPIMKCGSRSGGRIANIHFEHSPPPGMCAPAILIPNDGKAGRVTIDSVYTWFAGNLGGGKRSETVRIESKTASVTCLNVNHRTGTVGPLNNDTTAVHDVPRGKQGCGQASRGSSKSLALYARQHIDGRGYSVLSSDPDLE